jgi:sugar (pentulose or hexulose) kinase
METRYLPWGAGRLPNGFAGRFMLVGASLCGGRAYAWLNDVVRNWLGEFGFKVDREQAYERLNELATLAPADRGGLSARTTFAGTRSEPGLRGAVCGISLDNFSLGNMARSILAGMVEELCVLYDQAGGKSVYHHSKVVASGNAVRKNPLLPGMIGSRTACPVLIPRHREEAAFGAALLAGVSNGFWPSLNAAGRTIQYQ